MTSPNEPRWLSVEDVKRLHQRNIEQFGGSPGILDEGLLESAVMTPRQSAFGEPTHRTPEAQAAAYLFHITKAHAFEDGNKRTGLLACETFLGLNGKELSFSDREAYGVTMRVADGRMKKEELTKLFEGRIQDLQRKLSQEQTQEQAAPELDQEQKQQRGLRRGRGM